MSTCQVNGGMIYFEGFGLRGVSGFLLIAALLLSPFTWSYISSIEGMMIRAVDLALLASLLVMILRCKLARVSFLIPCLIYVLIIFALLRFMVFNDFSSLVSAIKITYYLSVVLVLSTAMLEVFERNNARLVICAFIFAAPVIFLFLINFVEVFVDLALNRSFLVPSEFIFNLWHQVFSENIFLSSGSIDVKGVSFRNSAGIALVVSGLFFYLLDGKISHFLAFFFMVLGALCFSRSVWLVQMIFLLLLVLKSKNSGRRIMLFSVLLLGAAAIAMNPVLVDAISSRITSDIGRSEMLSVGLKEFSDSVLFGRPDGATIPLYGGDYKTVHNIPLAFGLKMGGIGFLISSVIALIFFSNSMYYFWKLVSNKKYNNKYVVVIVVLSCVLFFRPLISASHDIYFSIGEWCSLAMFLALKKQIGRSIIS